MTQHRYPFDEAINRQRKTNADFTPIVSNYEPDLARVRGAIRDVLYAFVPHPLLSRDQLLLLGLLHRADSEELLRAGVPLPPPSARDE